MSEVDCDVRFLAMPNADAYLWVRDQPVDQVLLTRALNPPVRETPITYIRVHLGGAGMHAGVKQALDVQPLRARMVLVADGAGSGELAGLAKYYDMPVAASGVPDGDALGTGRLLSVDGEGRELDGAGDGAVWGLSPARVAAREVLRTALGGGGTREPSWPDLVRFLERAKEIRRKWGAAGQPGDAAEYVVGAALAYRGVGAGVDAAALARQVL
ncbi:MAG TPA: hypothetical protein VJT31_35265, partial [Rugosimonospora sp.]|nr:hypothetical protein [Rugosimonospora sp.]